MKITDVRIRAVRLVLPVAHSNCRWTWQNLDHSIVEVFTDEGITGIGAGGGTGVDWLVLNWAKPVVIGEDPFNYERIWNKLYTGIPPYLAREALNSGEAIVAISAVDTALWDIIGKALKQPVYKLIGGARDRIPAYASGGHYTATGLTELKALEKEMGAYLNAGFKAVKMRIGRFTIPEDAERVRVVRETIGKDAQLMLDANWSWTTAVQAIKFMRAVEKYDIFLLEEPVLPDNHEALREIGQAIDSHVASGESEFTLWACKSLIESRSVDILQVDATHCGGITEWRKIAALSRAHYIPLIPHGGMGGAMEINVHCAASLGENEVWSVEYFRPLDGWGETWQANALKVDKDGCIALRDTPGYGIVLDEEAIKEHQIPYYLHF
jgi:D-arabinonate dehydratase